MGKAWSMMGWVALWPLALAAQERAPNAASALAVPGVLARAGAPAWDLALGGQAHLRLGVQSDSAVAPEFAWSTLAAPAQRRLLSAQYALGAPRGVLMLAAGLLQESGARWGIGQGGTLDPNPRARTTFLAVSGAYALTPRLAVVGMAWSGHTARADDGAAAAPAAVGTMALSLGLSARALWVRDDRLGLTLSTPNKVTQGARTGTLIGLHYARSF